MGPARCVLGDETTITRSESKEKDPTFTCALLPYVPIIHEPLKIWLAQEGIRTELSFMFVIGLERV